MIIDGKISIGDLIAIQTLSAYFTGPVENLISLQLTFQEASIAMKRLGEIYSVESEIELNKNSLTDVDLNGSIELQNISFRYGSRPYVLKDLSLKIDTGTKVAIVGTSGSGKTTIAKLLLGYYYSDTGSVLINNYNIKDIHPHYLRSQIGYVSQDIELFTGSILENIRLWNTDISFEQVLEVSRSVGINEFIDKIAGGYNGFVEEDGTNFSGGEKQKMAIARALIKNPNIIIYDEATSNLDSFSERQIHSIMHEGNTKTTIIIAHRLSTIVECDKIFYIKDGNVYATGTHEELIETCKEYKEMIHFQYGKFIEDEDDIEHDNSDEITYY